MNHSNRKYVSVALIAASVFAASLSAQSSNPSATANAPAGATPDLTAPLQHRPGGPMRRLGFRRELAEKLGLSDAQKSQIKSARIAARQQIQAIRSDTTLSPEEKKARFRTVVDNARQQMKQALTPEQQQKFEQLQAEHRAHTSAQRPDSQ